ncbi:MAG TPA: preprotein translocase subunit SecE [Balneolales bacterium]|jgi:preprotein translocase subunit SecE|nr:preprotein translocase subunit SecE [Balneolales bacterium]
MNKIKEFIEGVRKEMKKVTWPSQKELVDNTAVVIVFSLILAAFIFGVDQLYSTVLTMIYR